MSANFDRSRNAKYSNTVKKNKMFEYEGGYYGQSSDSMTTQELIEHIDKEIELTSKTAINDKIRVKLVRGNQDTFQERLETALNEGFEIPNGEAMKIHESIYSILLVKTPKSTNKTYL